MGKTTGIEFGRLSGLVDILDGANRNISDILGDLEVEVGALRNGFTGEAAEAYARAHREWTAAAAEMNRLLNSARSAAGGVVERHRAAETEVLRLWGVAE